MTEPAQPKRRVLLCYDGSEESKRALERVAELAGSVEVEVTVVSVAEPLYHERPYAGMVDPAEEQEHRRLLDAATAELHSRGVEAETLEPVGEPGEAIVEAARQLGAGLVVVGWRHHRLIQRLLFGSVTGEVVDEAPGDVLVVR
jgi:nucleotide-binding universal stress UspA family protein